VPAQKGSFGGEGVPQWREYFQPCEQPALPRTIKIGGPKRMRH
jgi:hypothetical protein